MTRRVTSPLHLNRILHRLWDEGFLSDVAFRPRNPTLPDMAILPYDEVEIIE